MSNFNPDIRALRLEAYELLQKEEALTNFKKTNNNTQIEQSKRTIEQQQKRIKELEERMLSNLKTLKSKDRFIRANGVETVAKTYLFFLTRKRVLLEFLDKNAETTRPDVHTTKPMKELELMFIIEVLQKFESEEFFKCHMPTILEILKKKAGMSQGRSSAKKIKLDVILPGME